MDKEQTTTAKLTTAMDPSTSTAVNIDVKAIEATYRNAVATWEKNKGNKDLLRAKQAAKHAFDAVRTKKCINCHVEKPNSGYSKNQWRKDLGKGTCKVCQENDRPKPATRKCSICHLDKQKYEYPKKQWLKDPSVKIRCKECKNERKRKAVDAKIIQQRKQKRSSFNWKEYFLTPGVSYEMFWSVCNKLEYKQEKLQNKDLEGKYKLVFYSADRSCCDQYDQEDVHRTAKGWMEMRIGEWGGKQALVGNFSLNGGWLNCDDWSSGRLAEMVTDEKTYLEGGGMNVIGNADYEKYFLVGRGCDYGNWYEGAESEEPGYLNDWCGAKLSVVAKKYALHLSFDQLFGMVGVAPEYKGTRPKDLQHAEELFEDHHRRNHLWISRYLRLPSNVASIIHKFVAPPPVFFVQPNDLLLEVEESSEPEWGKYFLFRKVIPN